MADYLLGIDIGTTSTKGVLCALDGRVAAESSAPASLRSPKPGWAEEETEEWWANLGQVSRACLHQCDVPATAIAGIGISGMVPTLILLNQHGNVLRPSIQQNDARSYSEIDEFKTRTDQADILSRTGSDITQQSIGPKLFWLRRHEPEVMAHAAHVMGSYDLMVYRLTGHLSIERNWALESGLYSLPEQDWDDELLKWATIDRRWLGELHWPADVVGPVTRAAAQETELAEGTPVVAGCADHIASAFAAGLAKDGELLIKLGGAGDILYCLSRPHVSSRLFLDYHIVPGQYVVNGCMASSGSILEWFRTEFAEGVSFADLDVQAAALSNTAGPLILLPYFLGEKTPIFDPLARGVLFGLTLAHTRAHIYRAILEGIACAFYHHLQVLAEEGLHVSRARVADGGARSGLWKQIVADTLGLSLEGIASYKGSALGAAFVAGMGVGAFDDWTQIDRFLESGGVTEPCGDRREYYDRLYRLYRQVYQSLTGSFAELTRIH